MFKVAGLSFLQITIPGIVILFFYVYQYIGLPVLYFQLDEYRYLTGVDDKLLMLEVSAYTAYTITFMILGFIVGRKLFGVLTWAQDYDYRLYMPDHGKAIRFGLFMVFLLCLTVLVMYLSKVGFSKVAIFAAFGLNEDSIHSARSAMGNAFTGKFHRYYLFMNRLMLFVAYAYFALYLTSTRRISSKLLFYFVFLVTSFSMIMATEKAPMANFIIALFLIYVLIKKDGKVPVKGLLSIGLLIVAVLMFFYINFMGTENVISALSNVLSRAFTGSIQPVYHYLDFFPSHHDYLYGLGFPNPGGLLPYEPYPLTKELMLWRYPEQAELDVVGSMPTVYWGEMYANFGLAGILVVPFFVGLFLYWINSLIYKIQQGPLIIALYVWLIMHLSNLSQSSLSGYFFFYDTYLIVTLFFYFIIAFFAGKGVVRLHGREHSFFRYEKS